MRWRYWGDLTTKDFETLDPNRTIAVAPIAAHEQHGPHLPVATDTILGEGMVREVVARLPEDLDGLPVGPRRARESGTNRDLRSRLHRREALPGSAKAVSMTNWR